MSLLYQSKKEKVALKTLDKEAARHLVDVMIRASLNETDGRELSNTVKTKILPVDMIEAVRLYPDLTDTYDIVFKAPITGSTSVVDGKGWKDMTHSKVELERIVTVEFDPSNSRILFPSGGFKLGVHLEDTEFLYRKVSCGERLAISTFLKAYGYMSIMGSMTSPLQYSATVRSIENLDDTDLKLGFNIDDKCSFSFPKKGVEATRSCLNALQGAVDGVDLTKNELIDTFEHFTWKERSQ